MTAVRPHETSGVDPASDQSTTTAVFGALVLLASDLMLFAGFFAAYFMLRGQADTWPPAGVDLDVVAAAVGTLFLLGGSVTIQLAARARRAGAVGSMQSWLAVTAALGALFSLNQLRDYLTIDVSVSDNAYGGIYWTLTGLHGLHVLVAIALVAILSWRLSRAPTRTDAAMISTRYYWHLVSAVSVVLFIVIWVLQ